MTVTSSKTMFCREEIHLEQLFLKPRVDVKHNHFKEEEDSTALTPLLHISNSSACAKGHLKILR